jgi:excisionase family DNA binding protein
VTKSLSKAELKRRLSHKRKQRKAEAKTTSRAETMPAPQLDTLTVEEVAARLRIGRNQAYEACRSKIIPAIRVGERWLIPRAAFERLMRGETLGSAA